MSLVITKKRGVLTKTHTLKLLDSNRVDL
ncbi:uncharacterized protein METZ01_LOCUS311043, partial [marine metagenome]